MKKRILHILGGVLFVLVSCTTIQSADDVPRITKEELRARLGSPNMVMIDVRTEADWDASGEKIAGALRMDPNSVDTWAATLPKDKEIILYCS